MALYSRERTAQPNQAATVAFSNPLCAGLQVLALPHLFYDAVSGKTMSRTSSPTVSVGGGGNAMATNGTTSYASVAIPQFITSTWTVFGIFSGAAPGATGATIVSFCNSASSASVVRLAAGNVTTSKLDIWARDQSNVSATHLDSTKAVWDSKPHLVHIACEVVGGNQTLRCYIDGVFDSSTPINGGNFTINSFAVGCLLFGGSTANFCPGNTYFAGIANRTWSANEVAQHSANPYSLFVLQSRMFNPYGAGVAPDNLMAQACL